jgi:hypothetical protein
MGDVATRSGKGAHWWLIGALAFSLALSVYFALAFDWLSLDDVYISLRYARNWAEGHGPVYNPGEAPVEGYTNFAWTGLLALALKLGLPGPLTAKVLAELALLGTIIMAWLLARRLGGKEGWAGPAAAWGVALSGTAAFWGLAGAMEVAPLALALTAGFYLLLKLKDAAAGARRSRLLLGAGLLFALAGLLRPEGNLFTLAGLAYVWPGREGRIKRLLLYLLPVVVLVGGHEVFRLVYYGELLPNTFYAKVGLSGRLLLRGLRYLGLFLLSHAPLVLLAPALPRKQARRLLPVLIAVGLYVLYLVLIGGDWIVWRLFVPVLPLLAVCAGLGLERLRRAWSARMWAAVLTAVVAGGGLLALSTTRGEYAHLEGFTFHESLHFTTGEWLAAVSDPDDVMAVSSAGIMPWVTRLTTIDALGLNDRHIARYGVELGGLASPGHERYDNDYLLERAPEWIVLGLTTESLFAGTVPEFLPDRDLVARPELWRDYHALAPAEPTRAVLHRRDDEAGLERLPDESWRRSWGFIHPLAARRMAPSSAY